MIILIAVINTFKWIRITVHDIEFVRGNSFIKMLFFFAFYIVDLCFENLFYMKI